LCSDERHLELVKPVITKVNNKKSKKSNRNNTRDSIIRSSRHKPTFNTLSINRAVNRAMKDERFLDYALEKIRPMEFPAYKNDIINYLKETNTNDKDIISLFESLDGYILFNDPYHIRKSIEQNIPKKKIEYQISDQKRRNLDVRIRDTRSNKSIKEREAVSLDEERKDYPEVTPTAMSLFICSMCGKEFQNQDDLVHHRRFEGQIKEDKNGIGVRQSTATGQKTSHISSPVNEARNVELASRLANLLEGLEFPVTKSKVKDYIKQRSQILQQIEGPLNGTGDDNNILNIIENTLSKDSKTQYNNAYEIEKAAGLVVEKNRSKKDSW
jgi:hypothetical protein